MIDGAILIGSNSKTAADGFAGQDPTGKAAPEVRFSEAGPGEVEQACALADEAFVSFAATTPEQRAAFLEAVAEQILAIGDELITQAMQETGLPRPRLEGERGRTVGQLKLFASVVRQGDWVDATIDPALPDRAPLPRPDLRRRNVAIGPVAVFGASNFPLAFSVAGGDTASAFAAGCPVVVKGHPAHPGTGELVARAVQAAVKASGLHEGVFSFLPGSTIALGQALVADPRIKAVGFTGSRAGGLALVKTAAGRAEPIPVYAEMSSINPVILFPGALKGDVKSLATGFVQSLTMGAGQFCTNPGVVLALAGPELDAFLSTAGEALTGSAPTTMLSSGIHGAYQKGVSALEANQAVEVVARGGVGEGINLARGALFVTDAQSFLADAALGHEVFGSSSIVVRCADAAEIGRVLAGMEGQLTVTLHLTPEDEPSAATLIPTLERKAGRILANGWPTGVEVSHAMVHGGPYPATSDGRTTSVGALAIARFLRPVCYQSLSDALLPESLRDSNPWQIARRIEGKREPA